MARADLAARQPEQPNTGTVTEDAFLGGKLIVRQPARGYRAGLDAVLLAATIPANASGRILDVGAGVGTVGLCVAARLPSANVTLLERETVLAELARENISANGLADRMTIMTADIAKISAEKAALELTDASFSEVLANPPYHNQSSGSLPPDALKATSHAMADDGLETWVRFMTRMTQAGGRAVMIHKTEMLPRILQAYDGRFGAIRVLPIHPRAGESAHRILVSGIKGSRAPLSLLSGLVLHGAGNEFTPEVDAILRHGAALPL
ncbi:MAG: methyltransferase [Hyphomicrobium sp.]|nr:MAG: methyltransferase [Hyphomicrobium sp.]PPC99337.1 MAG: methyltransferase [Hyphomicrobium sp.]